MRVFLDTNILLDVLMDRPALAEESKKVLLLCEARQDRLFVGWHGLATAYYLLKRGRTEKDALREVDKILAWASVAACGDSEARRARDLEFPDFEDALQAAAAENCAADCIVTRNVADFQQSPVPAMAPSAFLKRFPSGTD